MVQDTLRKLGNGSISRRKGCQRCCLATIEHPYPVISTEKGNFFHQYLYICQSFLLFHIENKEIHSFKRTHVLLELPELYMYLKGKILCLTMSDGRLQG